MANALNAKDGRVWIQPGGAAKPMYLLSCQDAGDLTEPLGDIDLVRCYDNENRLQAVGQVESPPDPVTVTLTGLTFAERSTIENLEGIFALYFLYRSAGRADIVTNYVRGQLMAMCRKTQRSLTGTAVREEDVSGEVAIDISAWPPLWDIDQLSVGRIPCTGTLDAKCVAANTYRIDPGGDIPEIERGENVGIGMESAVAPATADVFFSTDYGAGSAAGATDPFAAGISVQSILRLLIGKETVRWLAANEAPPAGQGQVAYSDDDGTTWTAVAIGGAAAGHGAVAGKALFELGPRFIWLASAAGYIYKSEDYGESWEAKEEGVLTVGDYFSIHFADETHGIAGAAADVIVLSDDGGETWYAATATGGGGDILCCARLSTNIMWVGDDDGKLWRSEDGGVTWAQVTGWTGSGTGDVTALVFYNEFFGFMLHNSAAPVGTVLYTWNGGHDWEVLDTPSNNGLLDIAVIKHNYAYVVGAVEAATSFVGKVFAG